MVVHGGNWAWVLVAVGVAGCGRTLPPPAGTGARESVRDYCDGLVRQDWPQAYAALHPDSRRGITPEQFARLGQAFRHNLDFELTEFKVQTCEERGAEAIAHVVLIGGKAAHLRRYKEGIVLRHSGGTWRVILPENFGRTAR
jgi:hypothetical protein